MVGVRAPPAWSRAYAYGVDLPLGRLAWAGRGW